MEMNDQKSIVGELDGKEGTTKKFPRVEYRPERHTLLFARRYVHCVSVVERNISGMMTPQAHTELLGGDIVELDLSPKGDAAILRGPNGEKRIRVLPSANEWNRIIIGRYSGSNLCIGPLGSEQTDGKEGLINFLSEQFGRGVSIDDDFRINHLGTVVRAIAEARGLVAGEPDFVQEMKDLMNREDFSFGKDYSHLYSKEILLPRTSDSSSKRQLSKKEVQASFHEFLSGLQKDGAKKEDVAACMEAFLSREGRGSGRK